MECAFKCLIHCGLALVNMEVLLEYHVSSLSLPEPSNHTLHIVFILEILSYSVVSWHEFLLSRCPSYLDTNVDAHLWQILVVILLSILGWKKLHCKLCPIEM